MLTQSTRSRRSSISGGLPRRIGALLAGLALAAVTPSLAGATTYTVPLGGDLQLAIDNAQPWDVILIEGGDHPPIVIDKPLSLVAAAGTTPRLRPLTPSESMAMGHSQVSVPPAQPPILLSGPGQDEDSVALTGLTIGGPVSLAWFNNQPNAISGGGFDQLLITDCEIAAPTAFEPTGITFANEAIGVDVSFVMVSSSTVEGGSPVVDYGEWYATEVHQGGNGIRTSGDVTICDSTVLGGDGISAIGVYETTCAYTGGEGGAAVRTAGTICVTNSVVEGGDGSVLQLGQVPGTYCYRPAGPQYAGPLVPPVPPAFPWDPWVELPHGPLCGFNSLMLPPAGDLDAGSTLTLNWDSPNASSLLLAGIEPIVPIPFGGAGLLYMNPDLSVMFPLLVPTPGPNSWTFSVVDPLLIGRPLVFQVYNPATGLSRPVMDVYQP